MNPGGRVALTRTEIDFGALLASLKRDDAGAVVTFQGTVRVERNPDGRSLAALDYSAHEEMALEHMRDLRQQALQRFGILDAILVHRLGPMRLGETSVAVVVVAGHRAAAFEAGRWLIDAVKMDVPIWKKDVWNDGTATWTHVVQPESPGDGEESSAP